jgi:hypothetical protein
MKMTTQKRALDKIYKRRDRYEIPDWQREEVWSKPKRQKLIDTILRGWRIPKFYFLKTSDSEYEVVDGQQRLAAIYEFLQDELELPEEAAELYGGMIYTELDEKFSDGFDDFEIDIDEIEDATDEEIKEFFQRLQEGFPLSSSEKLNAVHSKLRNFARNLTKQPFFTQTVDFKNKRYAHFDVASKVMAIEIDGLEVGSRYEDLKAVFEANKNFSSSSKTAQRVVQALAFLNKALPDSSPLLRSRSLTQSIVTVACKLVENGVPEAAAKKFGQFVEKFGTDLAKQVELGHAATDPDLVEFQKTVNANVKTGPKTRHTILLRKLFEFDPHFAEFFDALAVKVSGIDKEIVRLAASIRELITSINEAESALNGKDLFKATNKTTAALSNIATAATDYEAYKGLVDDLYFLLWEGPGSKLSGKEPQSFKDVNSLRTALQHDVDHGSGSKVKKKNKELGSVFQSYAGVASPAVAAPERFPVVHVKLLANIEGDLQTMKKSYEAEPEAA